MQHKAPASRLKPAQAKERTLKPKIPVLARRHATKSAVVRRRNRRTSETEAARALPQEGPWEPQEGPWEKPQKGKGQSHREAATRKATGSRATGRPRGCPHTTDMGPELDTLTHHIPLGSSTSTTAVKKYQQLFIKRRPGPAAACARRRRATERSPAELPGGPPGGVQRGHTSGNIERARRIDNRRAAASVMKYLDIPPMVVLPSCTRLLDALRNYAVKSTRGSLTRVHIKQQQQKNIYYKNDDSSKSARLNDALSQRIIQRHYENNKGPEPNICFY